MKKIILTLGLLLIAPNCFAGTISIDTLSSDASITYAWFNNSMNAIKNEFNGEVESINIMDGTINSADIAAATNPLKRDGENIGEYVYSGLTIATVASLSQTTTAGVAYVANDADGYLHRVSTAATAHTYTASRDTYVYLDYAGAFIYSEVANGAAQPSTPSNSTILAKVVTNGTDITAVTDLRQTIPVNLRVYSYVKNGLVLSRDVSTATKITVTGGEIELGGTSKRRANADSITLDFTTNGLNGLDTGLTLAANTYYYIFAVPSDVNATNFKVVADTASTDTAIAAASDERLIGWCYAPTASAISGDSVGAFRKYGGDAPNVVARTGNDDITTTSTSMITMANMDIRFVSSGRPLLITFAAPYRNDADDLGVSISVDSVGVAGHNYFFTPAAQPQPINLTAYVPAIAGTHLIEGKWSSNNSGTTNQEGLTQGKRVIMVQEL